MKWTESRALSVAVIACLALFVSCSKKEEQPGTAKETDEQKNMSYINEEISFGIFFDEEGTKRTLELQRNQKEFTAYLILTCPEYLQVAAVEWRIVLPEGVSIINDRYRKDRVLSMGTMEHGQSERFVPCVSGPRILLHTFTCMAEVELSNATFAVMPSLESDYLGVAECKHDEGYPMIRGASFKAVVNPAD